MATYIKFMDRRLTVIMRIIFPKWSIINLTHTNQNYIKTFFEIDKMIVKFRKHLELPKQILKKNCC